MSMNFKKMMLKRQTYLPKNEFKHKHSYTIRCLLEIKNVNIHASSNYYNSVEYHYVLKCELCDSFIPESKEGNFNGAIFDEDSIDKQLPLIVANTNQKNPIYDFCDLFDIVVKKTVITSNN